MPGGLIGRLTAAAEHRRGVTTSDPTCADGGSWSFPNSMLQSVGEQYNLLPVAYSESDGEFDVDVFVVRLSYS